MSSPSSALFVLFEGPWLFSPHHSGVVATTFGDLPVGTAIISHSCAVGCWDSAAGTLNPPPGCSGNQQLDYGEHFHGRLSYSHLGDSFEDVFVKTCKDAKAVYLEDPAFKLEPDGKDRHVSLPMPSVLLLGGKRVGTDVVSGGATLDVQPYVDAIFQYNPTDEAGADPKLTIHDENGELFTVDASHHLIFRMQFTASKEDHCAAPGSESEHVAASFTELLKRVHGNPAKTSLSLDIRNLNCDQTPVLTMGADELGLTQPPPPGTFQARDTNPGNCAGGNLVFRAH